MDDQPSDGRSDGTQRPDDATQPFRAPDKGDADADPTAVVPPPGGAAGAPAGRPPADGGPGNIDSGADAVAEGSPTDRPSADGGPGDIDSGDGGFGDGRGVGDTAELPGWDAGATERIDMDGVDLDEPTRATGNIDSPTEALRGDVDSPTEAMHGDVDSTAAMRAEPGAPIGSFGQEDDVTGPIDPDATRAVGPPDPDATRAVGPPDPDATQFIPPGQQPPPRPPDQTAVAPPLPQGWVGQAQVRPRDPEDDPNAVWVPVGSQHRAWWLPILLGVLGLLLILGIVYGLIVASRNNNPTPTQTPTVPTAPATPTTTAPATSAAPSPSTPTSALVTIPANLTQLDINAATQTLQALGLVPDPRPETVTDPAQANRVLHTEPGPGTQVAPGSTVTLVYGRLAAPPSSPPPSSAPPSPSPSPS